MLEQIRDELAKGMIGSIRSQHEQDLFCDGFDACLKALREMAPEFNRQEIEDECPNVTDDEWILRGATIQYKKDAALIAARDAKIDRLHRVIAQELTENDELGSEYTYVNALKDEIKELRAAAEALAAACEWVITFKGNFAGSKALQEYRTKYPKEDE